MHVLITRPEADCAAMKASIEGMGCRVSLAPLLKIESLDIAADALAGAAAVVATSRNGLRALRRSLAFDTARGLPLFVVGPATAALAASLGFRDIREGAGTAADLPELIAASSPQGRLVHLAGDHLAFDLAEAIKGQGMDVIALQAYRSVAAETLPAVVVDDLGQGTIDAVILMSPRSAHTWAKLTDRPALLANVKRLTHICMSEAVVKALESITPIKTLTALRPTSEEIVALVYRLAAERRSG